MKRNSFRILSVLTAVAGSLAVGVPSTFAATPGPIESASAGRGNDGSIPGALGNCSIIFDMTNHTALQWNLFDKSASSGTEAWVQWPTLTIAPDSSRERIAKTSLDCRPDLFGELWSMVHYSNSGGGKCKVSASVPGIGSNSVKVEGDCSATIGSGWHPTVHVKMHGVPVKGSGVLHSETSPFGTPPVTSTHS